MTITQSMLKEADADETQVASEEHLTFQGEAYSHREVIEPKGAWRLIPAHVLLRIRETPKILGPKDAKSIVLIQKFWDIFLKGAQKTLGLQPESLDALDTGFIQSCKDGFVYVTATGSVVWDVLEFAQLRSILGPAKTKRERTLWWKILQSAFSAAINLAREDRDFPFARGRLLIPRTKDDQTVVVGIVSFTDDNAVDRYTVPYGNQHFKKNKSNKYLEHFISSVVKVSSGEFQVEDFLEFSEGVGLDEEVEENPSKVSSRSTRRNRTLDEDASRIPEKRDSQIIPRKVASIAKRTSLITKSVEEEEHFQSNSKKEDLSFRPSTIDNSNPRHISKQERSKTRSIDSVRTKTKQIPKPLGASTPANKPGGTISVQTDEYFEDDYIARELSPDARYEVPGRLEGYIYTESQSIDQDMIAPRAPWVPTIVEGVYVSTNTYANTRTIKDIDLTEYIKHEPCEESRSRLCNKFTENELKCTLRTLIMVKGEEIRNANHWLQLDIDQQRRMAEILQSRIRQAFPVIEPRLQRDVEEWLRNRILERLHVEQDSEENIPLPSNPYNLTRNLEQFKGQLKNLIDGNSSKIPKRINKQKHNEKYTQEDALKEIPAKKAGRKSVQIADIIEEIPTPVKHDPKMQSNQFQNDALKSQFERTMRENEARFQEEIAYWKQQAENRQEITVREREAKAKEINYWRQQAQNRQEQTVRESEDRCKGEIAYWRQQVEASKGEITALKLAMKEKDEYVKNEVNKSRQEHILTVRDVTTLKAELKALRTTMHQQAEDLTRKNLKERDRYATVLEQTNQQIKTYQDRIQKLEKNKNDSEHR